MNFNEIIITIAVFVLGYFVAHIYYKLSQKSQKEELKKLSCEIKEYLREIGLQLDPKQLPAVTKEISDKIDRLEHLMQKQAVVQNPNFMIKLGNTEYARSNYSKAMELYREALRISEITGDKQNIGNCLGNIGLVHMDMGDLDSALEHHEKAFVIHREIGYRLGEANHLGNIGIIYFHKGNLNKALEYLKDALAIHQEIEYRQGEANQLGNIGEVYMEMGNLGKALKYSEDSLKIIRKIGYRYGEAVLLGNIGIIYKKKGELEKALSYLKESIDIFDKHGFYYYEKDKFLNAISEIENELKKK